jgi:hypothetical protein
LHERQHRLHLHRLLRDARQEAGVLAGQHGSGVQAVCFGAGVHDEGFGAQVGEREH